MTEQRDAERKPVPQPQSKDSLPVESTADILSDEDLESVAGGSDTPPPGWKP